MRTDRLIDVLAVDDTTPRPIGPRLMMQAGPALIATAVLALSILGIRPDLGAALANPTTLMKWLLPLAVAIPALRAALRLTRPQIRRTPAQFIPALIGVLALVWLALAAASTAPDQLWPQMRGRTALICLTSVTFIGLAPLLVGLRILREGACVSPTVSGAMLGLASGGLAAALYALHCNQDAPLFFLTWYGLAILGLVAAGALLGRHFLRW